MQAKRNTTMLSKAGWVGLAMLALTACDNKTLMHSYLPVKSHEWNRKDVMTFQIPKAPQSGTYDMTIGLRIGNRFPYETIFMLTEVHLHNPEGLLTDTICYNLTNEKGEFLAKGINLLQFETETMPLQLRKGQSGDIRIQHLMHREVLPEIADIGISIQRH